MPNISNCINVIIMKSWTLRGMVDRNVPLPLTVFGWEVLEMSNEILTIKKKLKNI